MNNKRLHKEKLEHGSGAIIQKMKEGTFPGIRKDSSLQLKEFTN